jgi:hypothetical protein
MVVMMSNKSLVKEARLRQWEPYCSHKWMLQVTEVRYGLRKNARR